MAVTLAAVVAFHAEVVHRLELSMAPDGGEECELPVGRSPVPRHLVACSAQVVACSSYESGPAELAGVAVPVAAAVPPQPAAVVAAAGVPVRGSPAGESPARRRRFAHA